MRLVRIGFGESWIQQLHKVKLCKVFGFVTTEAAASLN
jgi:hypothetical protein